MKKSQKKLAKQNNSFNQRKERVLVENRELGQTFLSNFPTGLERAQLDLLTNFYHDDYRSMINWQTAAVISTIPLTILGSSSYLLREESEEISRYLIMLNLGYLVMTGGINHFMTKVLETYCPNGLLPYRADLFTPISPSAQLPCYQQDVKNELEKLAKNTHLYSTFTVQFIFILFITEIILLSLFYLLRHQFNNLSAHLMLTVLDIIMMALITLATALMYYVYLPHINLRTAARDQAKNLALILDALDFDQLHIVVMPCIGLRQLQLIKIAFKEPSIAVKNNVTRKEFNLSKKRALEILHVVAGHTVWKLWNSYNEEMVFIGAGKSLNAIALKKLSKELYERLENAYRVHFYRKDKLKLLNKGTQQITLSNIYWKMHKSFDENQFHTVNYTAKFADAAQRDFVLAELKKAFSGMENSFVAKGECKILANGYQVKKNIIFQRPSKPAISSRSSSSLYDSSPSFHQPLVASSSQVKRGIKPKKEKEPEKVISPTPIIPSPTHPSQITIDGQEAYLIQLNTKTPFYAYIDPVIAQELTTIIYNSCIDLLKVGVVGNKGKGLIFCNLLYATLKLDKKIKYESHVARFKLKLTNNFRMYAPKQTKTVHDSKTINVLKFNGFTRSAH